MRTTRKPPPKRIVYNVDSYGSTISTTSALESTLHSQNFIAPGSGEVRLSFSWTATLAGNGVALQVWYDVASGPSNSRQSHTVHVHTATQRKGSSSAFHVSGLTPGQTYSARIRWIGPGGTTRSMTTGDNEQAYILVENYV